MNPLVALQVEDLRIDVIRYAVLNDQLRQWAAQGTPMTDAEFAELQRIGLRLASQAGWLLGLLDACASSTDANSK